MCHSGGKWKREQVPDHKFDFVDVSDYNSKAFSIRLQYLWVYILVIKSFLVYISDIYTATTMLTSTTWQNKIFTSCGNPDGCVAIKFDIVKWLFVGCILFSFLLLGFEARKAKKIIKSRDISFAFTNIMAQNYYSLRSFNHFCFFCHIEDSTKKKDDFAFFIFFTFKGWKRLLLADGPRQTINMLTLLAFYRAKVEEPGDWYELDKYFDKKDMTTNVLLIAMLFTVLIFLGSLLLLIAAAILYVPLLCYIRGNLKEYCCHKVDKRIAELLKRKQKQRVARVQQLAKKEAAGDFSHRKDKDGVVHAAPQPTLPNISLEDDDDRTTVKGGAAYASSVRTGKDSYWASDYKEDPYAYAGDYPPMPAYDPAAYPPSGYGHNGYTASAHGDDSTLYDHDQPYNAKNYNQQAHLPGQPDPYGADPYGRNNVGYGQQDSYQQQQGYNANNGYDNYGQQDYRTHTPANGAQDHQRGWSNDYNARGGQPGGGGQAL